MKSQRENIIEFIKEKYDAEPEFLWKKFPTYAVFRNKQNKKWFATLMRIPKSKLHLEGSGEIEVMNIKCDQYGIWQLLDEDNGFLPAYHMNKKHWISVLLDDSLELSRIKNLLSMSYDLIAPKMQHKD